MTIAEFNLPIRKSKKFSTILKNLLFILLCLVFWKVFKKKQKSKKYNYKTINNYYNRYPDSFSHSNINKKIKIHDLNKIVSTPNPLSNNEEVLILTPTLRFSNRYWQNINNLLYNHSLISLGFIVPRTSEGEKALKQLELSIKELNFQNKLDFKKITILRQEGDTIKYQKESFRHKLNLQKKRRSLLAMTRNSLLFSTISPTTSWILWIDADIIETPSTLIQDLASFNKSIIAPNVFVKYFDKKKQKLILQPYDLNNWIETKQSIRKASFLKPDEVLFEGYSELSTYRNLMVKFYNPQLSRKLLIKLDGVGSSVLLVKAEVHRDGAVFPSFPFYNSIESEGFAKMAKRLGYESFGLPNYLAFHKTE